MNNTTAAQRKTARGGERCLDCQDLMNPGDTLNQIPCKGWACDGCFESYVDDLDFRRENATDMAEVGA